MKTLQTLLLMASLSLLGAITVFGTPPTTQGPGCLALLTTDPAYGTRNDNIYYTDCFPGLSGETDDSLRLQRAVNKTTGKLIFNEDLYYISDTIKLHSYLTIEGLAPGKYGSSGSNPRIVLLVDGKSVFQIGSAAIQIAIRDLGLYYYGPGTNPVVASSANGILATEDPSGGGYNMLSSQGFQFSNLRFTNFFRGIYVNSQDSSKNWQFDDVHISDTTFETNAHAIYLDCNNTGWQMNNLHIASNTTQNGIWIMRGGYISMNMIVGNGHVTCYPGTLGEPDECIDDAGEFIHLDKFHGPTSIQNSNGEGYRGILWIKGRNSARIYPVELINNVLPACPSTDSEGAVYGTTVNFTNAVGLNDAQVFSHGNYYACGVTLPTERVSRPEIKGYSEVVSTVDKFCRTASSFCFDSDRPFDHTLRSEFALMTNTGVLRGDYLMDTNSASGANSAFDWEKPIFEINSSWDVGTGLFNFKPLLALTSSRYNPTTGAYSRWSYTFARNVYTGRLEVKGNETAPRTGFHFQKGPVQLQSVTQSDLSGYDLIASTGQDDSGSLLYCSNCTAGSTPCASGGGGALALKVGSAWHCK